LPPRPLLCRCDHPGHRRPHRHKGAQVSDASIPLTDRAQAPTELPLPPAGCGLDWRPLEFEDAQRLHELFGRLERADNPPYRTTLEEARENFTGEWKDPKRNSLGGFCKDGHIRAFGTVVVHPGDTRVVRAFLEGGVDPQWRRR